MQGRFETQNISIYWIKSCNVCNWQERGKGTLQTAIVVRYNLKEFCREMGDVQKQNKVPGLPMFVVFAEKVEMVEKRRLWTRLKYFGTIRCLQSCISNLLCRERNSWGKSSISLWRHLWKYGTFGYGSEYLQYWPVCVVPSPRPYKTRGGAVITKVVQISSMEENNLKLDGKMACNLCNQGSWSVEWSLLR